MSIGKGEREAMKEIPPEMKAKYRGKVRDIVAHGYIPTDVKIANIVAIIAEVYGKGYTRGSDDSCTQKVLEV